MSKQTDISGGSVWKRLGFPFLLFSTVLAVLLVGNQLFILPRVTKVDVGGVSRSVQELRGLRTELTEQIQELEERRAQQLHPVSSALLQRLLGERIKQTGFSVIRERIVAQAKTRSPVEGAVNIHDMVYEPGNKLVRITGMVQKVGPRSMTVLSQFAGSLLQLPFVAGISGPRYERKDEAGTGPYSPFSIHITLP